MKIDRTIRRSQAVLPFGVGAIYDFGDESFIALDISSWPGDYESLRLPRLENSLSSQGRRINGFRAAPKIPSFGGFGMVNPHKSVPFMRFPTWLFCQSCRRMHQWRWDDETPGEQPVCKNCRKKSRLVPMRFIAVCQNGHLGDVNWVRWAHSKPTTERQKQCRIKDLKFITRPEAGGGLQSLLVQCTNPKCKASRDLGDIVRRDALRQIGTTCSGKQPWQHHDNSEECDQTPQVVQRGASNAYFPVVVSAIDIRAASDENEKDFSCIENHHYWPAAKGMYDSAPNQPKEQFQFFLDAISDSCEFSPEEIWDYLNNSVQHTEQTGDEDNSNLLEDEWLAFLNPASEDLQAQFIAEEVDFLEYETNLPKDDLPSFRLFRQLVKRVVLARKLRIVKALQGFQRLKPEVTVPVDLGRNYEWLPGYEIFGEGIFLQIDENSLALWEKNIPPAYLDEMQAARNETTLDFLPEVTTRFVLLHTLSHLLIRQLCFECGYSSSALAERIYCSSSGEESMAGILLYTASGDSEGGMGGLVRQGEADLFPGSFALALRRGQWCSNDPICSELHRQGLQGLNKGACHACSLVSETSCEYANTLLDRGVLFGNDDAPGFFDDFLESLRKK